MDLSKKQFSFSRVFRITLRLTFALFLMTLVWSCATVPGLQEETVATYIKVPFIRVLLDENSSQVTVGGDAAFSVECLRDGKQDVYYSGSPVSVLIEGRLLTVLDKNGALIEEKLDEVNLIPRGAGNRLRLDRKRYRGILKILPNGEKLQMVNILYMEDYLRGVVPPEIGPRSDDEIEAVKAQAVAARTYAMAHLKQYGNKPYDMKSSIIDQVYDGVNVEKKLVNRAIDKTSGMVITYQDNLINAYYHSTCGGYTDNIEDVWERKEEPYLISVEDGKACSWSKYFTWREVFTERQLRGRVEQYLSGDRGRDLRIGLITDVTISGRTAGGRVAKLTIRSNRDTFRFYKDRIRWVIGRTSNPDLILPSDRFDIELKRDSIGNLSKVIFKGSGYGHGVGMCQCGAIGHARNGKTYKDILSLYYSGVEIRKLY